ncbi:MAG: 4-hydroxy-tetrahydrodipicolinate synthase [Deltaproteobacteria bacterium]|nr:4-hydroxy-tetrahydrodipicolinate synthase [Deltaproteobacteria bacterium]
MFSGALTALITPMRDGAIDLAALRDLVEWQIAEGIDGLVACGTTGETPTLSLEEQRQVIRAVVETTRGRVPVIAGAGANDTTKALAASAAATELGVDALLHVTPYYNKPPQRGLLTHFRTVADAATKPIVLYNVPGRTGCRLEAETVAALAEHPQIVAVKEAAGDIAAGQALIAACAGREIAVLSGDDALAMALTCMGGRGVISVVSNIAPRKTAQLIAATREGHLDEARRLHYELLPLINLLFCESNPIPVKAAAARLGFGANELRPPLAPLESEKLAALEAELDRQGIQR